MVEPQANAPSPDRPQIQLRCRVDGTMLGLLRDFVCGVARNLGFPEQQVAEIEICVDEACANVFEHAYRRKNNSGSTEQTVLVEIIYSGEEMTVRVADQGDGEMLDYPSNVQSLQQYVESNRENYRGLGFLLMQKYMDRVDVRSIPGHGTTVELMKIRNK